MQIASSRKNCTCDTCKSSKVNNSSDAKSITENGVNNSSTPQKSSAKSRQTKAKNRYAFGNQHRLDHTYAANFVEMPKFDAVVNSRKESVTSDLAVQNVDSQDYEDVVIVDIVNDETDGKNSNGSTNPDSEKTNAEDINLKSNWLRNLCLEYQPPKEKLQNNLNGVFKDDNTSNLNSLKKNGIVKQWKKSRKHNKTVRSSSLLTTSKINKSIQEDNKRWIAALALMELAQSK